MSQQTIKKQVLRRSRSIYSIIFCHYVKYNAIKIALYILQNCVTAYLLYLQKLTLPGYLFIYIHSYTIKTLSFEFANALCVAYMEGSNERRTSNCGINWIILLYNFIFK